MVPGWLWEPHIPDGTSGKRNDSLQGKPGYAPWHSDEPDHDRDPMSTPPPLPLPPWLWDVIWRVLGHWGAEGGVAAEMLTLIVAISFLRHVFKFNLFAEDKDTGSGLEDGKAEGETLQQEAEEEEEGSDSAISEDEDESSDGDEVSDASDGDEAVDTESSDISSDSDGDSQSDDEDEEGDEDDDEGCTFDSINVEPSQQYTFEGVSELTQPSDDEDDEEDPLSSSSELLPCGGRKRKRTLNAAQEQEQRQGEGQGQGQEDEAEKCQNCDSDPSPRWTDYGLVQRRAQSAASVDSNLSWMQEYYEHDDEEAGWR